MSDLFITNTLSRQKEKFEPLNPPFVGLYVCGPTVYSPPHLGNVRTFMAFDIVNRWLRFLGYKVRYVRNITDVGHIVNAEGEEIDRVGEQAKKEDLEPMEIVQKYTLDFFEVMQIFNIQAPDIEPTASGHIVEQIEMVERIIENGYAYEKNGSVYFDVPHYAKDHDYGSLSGQNIEEMQDGYRELDAQDEKKDHRDFAIWKFTGKEYPMRWKSKWGEGVPGWHLECSVMSTKYLGMQFDIHGGGMDLKFPHHECEIAQSVGADNIKPVKYWMHSNMLTMNGKKMSKSLGNSVLPKELLTGDHDLLEQGYSPMTVRFFMLQSHYSSTLDLSNAALLAAEKGYRRLINAYCVSKGLEYNSGEINETEETEIKAAIQACHDHMNDDFNTAQTLASLFEISNKVNAFANEQLPVGSISEETFNLMNQTFQTFISEILGLLEEGTDADNVVSGLMELILDIRKDARTNKDWGTSDKIRDQLNSLSIAVKDGKEGGTTWSYE